MDNPIICATINNALQTDLRKSDFIAPQPERVQALFRLFLLEVVGVEDNSMSLLGKDISMARAVPNIWIFQHMKTFIATLAPELDFHLCDVIQPDPLRFRQFAGLLAEYIEFSEAVVPVWKKMDTVYKHQNKRLVEMRKQYAEACDELERRKNRIDEALSHLSEQQTRFYELYRTLEAEELRLEFTNETLAEAREKLDELHKDKKSAEVGLNYVSGQILQSPERVAQEVAKLREELENSREEEEKERKKGQDIAMDFFMLPSVTKLLSDAEASVHQIFLDHEISKSKMAELTKETSLAREVEETLTHLQQKFQAVNLESEEIDRSETISGGMGEEQKREMMELSEKRNALERDVSDLLKNQLNRPRDLSNHTQMMALRHKKTEKLNAIREEMESLVANYKEYMNIYEEKKRQLTEEISHFRAMIDEIEEAMIAPLPEEASEDGRGN